MKKTSAQHKSDALRVLILEDSPADAELIERQLRRAGISFASQLVDGKKEFAKSLDEFKPQVILSDFKMPRFDGLAALEIARTRMPDIPFIFVSGSIGEEKAIETLSLGASDYIFKDNLARLGPAVKRVVEEARLRREKKTTDEELRHHAEELRLLSEASDRFVHINDLDKIFEYLAKVIGDISGADYLLLSLYDDKLQALRPKIATGFESLRETMHRRFHRDPMEMIFYLKDMRPDDFNDFISRRLLPVRDGLYGLSNRKMPRPLSRLMEKFLGIGAMHRMGFSWENQLFGELTVFFKKGNGLKNGSQIEALVNLAAVAIKRLIAEKSLGESERMFFTLVANLPGFVYRCRNDKDWTMEYISDGCREITGYAPEDFIHNRKLAFNDIIHPEHRDKLWQKLQEDLAKRQPFEMEYRIVSASGENRWIWERGQGIFSPDGSLLFLEGFITDITGRRQMEDQLRQNEEKYRLIADNTAETITALDMDLKFTYISPSIVKLRGFTVEETLNQTLQETLTPDSFAKIQEIFKEEMALEASASANPGRTRSLELQEYRKDGSIVWVENSMSYLRNPQGKAIGFLAVSKDISERKQAEAEILRQKAFLEKLVEAAPEGIAITDRPGRVLQVNNEFVKMFGYEADEAIGRNIDHLLVPPEHVREANRVTRSVGSGTTQNLETVRKRKDGTLINVSIIGTPIYIEKEQVAVYAIYRDITERKRSEERIQYQADLLQNVSDAIIASDQDGHIQVWNKAAERIYGWNAREAIGENFHDMIQPEYRFQSREEVIEKLDREGAWSGEIIHNLRDGRQIPVQSTITVMKDAAGDPAGTVSVNHDISERMRAEEQVRSSLREKEVLLQEIHHRVKNNLQIISGLLTLQADQSAGKSLDEVFHESQDRIHTIALIHEKLYRSHNLAEIAFDDYLRALTENLFSSHGIAAGRVSASYDMEKILLTIEKAIPLGLIVNELLTNSLKHAFPGERRGEIRIRLRGYGEAKSFALKTDSGTLHVVPTCELIVADDGIGLPPGFSLAQQKTLGMSLVSMLAKQLQADLKVKSGPGAEFRLVFTGLPAGTPARDERQTGGA